MLAQDWSLLPFAKRQGGVISYEQARAVGFTKNAIQHRLESGVWARVLPGVARMFWAEDSWDTRCEAAALWLGAEGALSHLTAAKLHDFDVEPQCVVHVTTRRGRGRLRRSGFTAHRSRCALRTVQVSGFRVTEPARTMVDLAAVLDELELERLLRLALLCGQVTRAAMQAEVARLTRGNRGAKKLRRVFNRLVRVEAS